jgi:hypothetical protein
LFCSNCGAQAPDTAKFCTQCGLTLDFRTAGVASSAPLSEGAVAIVTARPKSGSPVTLIAMGFIVGGTFGFLLRPSTFLIGQLPFATVITRGTSLSGFDQILVPMAQQSFNLMLIGAVIGMISGLILDRMIVIGRR